MCWGTMTPFKKAVPRPVRRSRMWWPPPGCGAIRAKLIFPASCWACAAVIAPVLAALAYDMLGSYTISFVILAIPSLLAGAYTGFEAIDRRVEEGPALTRRVRRLGERSVEQVGKCSQHHQQQ